MSEALRHEGGVYRASAHIISCKLTVPRIGGLCNALNLFTFCGRMQGGVARPCSCAAAEKREICVALARRDMGYAWVG